MVLREILTSDMVGDFLLDDEAFCRWQLLYSPCVDKNLLEIS